MPFSPASPQTYTPQLIARINAVLRRTEIPEDTRKRLVFDKLEINLDSYELAPDSLQRPLVRNILHLFPEALDMHIHRPAVAEIIRPTSAGE